MPGPCCYKSNVKAAYVSGIIFIVFWVLTILIKIFDGSDIIGQSHRILFKTIEGIICILINGLLVYGAHARNSAALLVWIVLAVIESVYLCLIVILFSVLPFAISSFRPASFHQIPDWIWVIYVIYFAAYFGIFLFTILTIIVAKNARKEIKEGYKEGFGERNVQEMKNTNE